jgi:hypothetical protein
MGSKWANRWMVSIWITWRDGRPRKNSGSTIHIPVSLSGSSEVKGNQCTRAHGYVVELCWNEKKSRTRATCIALIPTWDESVITNTQSCRGPSWRQAGVARIYSRRIPCMPDGSDGAWKNARAEWKTWTRLVMEGSGRESSLSERESSWDWRNSCVSFSKFGASIEAPSAFNLVS